RLVVGSAAPPSPDPSSQVFAHAPRRLPLLPRQRLRRALPCHAVAGGGGVGVPRVGGRAEVRGARLAVSPPADGSGEQRRPCGAAPLGRGGVPVRRHRVSADVYESAAASLSS